MITAASVAVVFALPWVVPVPIAAVVSDSQALGFSNRAAIVGLVIGAIALFLLAFAARRSGAVDDGGPFVSLECAAVQDRVRPWLIGVVMALVVLMVAGVAATMGDRPFADAYYFTNVLLRASAGAAPFSQVEFSYGPLMVYVPLIAWQLLRWTGLGIYPVYYFFVGVFHILGLACAAYLLNRIQLSKGLRNAAFLIVAGFALLQPTLGLNGTWLRFLLPYFLMVWVVRRLVASPGGLIERILPLGAVAIAAGVSPELGIGLLFALVVALVVLIRWDSKVHVGSLVVLVCGALAIVVLLAIVGAGRLTTFAGGAYYLPVLPGPPALIFVGAVLLMAWGIGAVFDSPPKTDSALQAGWLALALVLVAPALGRADFGHVFFNGLGAMLVCAAIIDRAWHRAGIFLGAVAVVFLGASLLYLQLSFVPALIGGAVSTGAISKRVGAVAANALGKPRLSRDLGRQGPSGESTAEAQIASELAAIPDLVFPLWLKGPLGTRLADSGSLAPLYYNPALALDQSDYRKAVAQLGASVSIALPATTLKSYEAAARGAKATPDGSVMVVPATVGGARRYGMLLGFPVAFKGRNAVFDPTASFGLLLQRDWVEYDRIGGYVILKKR